MPGFSLNLKDFGVRAVILLVFQKGVKKNAALNLDRVLGMWPCRHLGEPQEYLQLMGKNADPALLSALRLLVKGRGKHCS